MDGDSAWSAAVVLVEKEDGSTRLCVDFRALNAITTPISYPLPRMKELLHATTKAIYITVLDLSAGYNQLKVYGRDRDKNSFGTPFGDIW